MGKGRGVPYCAKHAAKVPAKIKKSLTRWGLTLSIHKAGLRFGNKKHAKNTLRNMKCMISQMERFCALVGDYDSLIILHKNCPKHPIAMNLDTIIQFVRYKFLPEGTLLTGLNDEPIKDVDGEDVLCIEAWSSPKHIESFAAAVANLHRARNNGMPYVEVCEECQKSKNTNGCRSHEGSRQRFRKGKPTNSDLFRNEKAAILTLREEHEVRGAMAILPWEMRVIRSVLVNALNYFSNFVLYVALLVSVFAFLRFDEFHKVKIEDFITPLHRVNSSGIVALCIKVKGKCDRKWCYLLLWANDECPEFCPVRHVLILIYLLGIKGGYLFPSLRERQRPPPDGIYKTKICGRTIISVLKDIYKSTIGRAVASVGRASTEPEDPSDPRTRPMRVGTHSGRHTGWQWGVLGGGKDIDIMAGARQVTEDHAKKYRKDERSPGCKR